MRPLPSDTCLPSKVWHIVNPVFSETFAYLPDHDSSMAYPILCDICWNKSPDDAVV